jgi:hypothetical protein
MSKSKNDPETATEKKPGLFEHGGPGGPGRPQGSRNAATLVLDKIADDAGEAILEKMVEAAKSGDMRAAELVLQRIWPARKSRPIALTLPAIQSAFDVVAAVGAVADERRPRQVSVGHGVVQALETRTAILSVGG